MLTRADLGKKIKRLRIGRGFPTQIALARRLHIESATVSAWENGKSYPDVPTIYALAELFEMSIDELLGKPNQTPDAADAPAQAFLNELGGVVTRRFRDLATKLDEGQRREVVSHFDRQTGWAREWYARYAAHAPPSENQIPEESKRRPDQEGSVAGEGRAAARGAGKP
jgi:transcriptional regulator with XRE-family HTH domain